MGISWMNGSFRAAVIRRGVVRATWVAPAPVTTLDAFAEALRLARSETAFRGRDVRVVMDNRELVYHLEEAPPGKPAIVQRLLDRVVKQRPFFDEPALWSFHPAPPSAGKHRVLLTLLAESTGKALQRICDQSGLILGNLVAPATLLARELTASAAEANEPVLLADCVDGMLCLLTGVPGRGVYFSRSVSLDDSAEARIVQEIDRTLMFTQQQFGVVINHCHLLDGSLKPAVEAAPSREGRVFTTAVDAPDPFRFAVGVAKLPVESTANLVTCLGHDTQSARRGLARAAIVLALASVALAGLVEFGIAVNARGSSTLRASLEGVDRHSQSAEDRTIELAEQRALLATLDPARNPPVPVLFARRIWRATPQELTLTAVRIGRDEESGTFRIEGYGEASVSSLIRSLQAYEESLSGDVFQAVISDGSLRRMFQESRAFDGVEPLRTRPDGTHEFFIEGRLR